jgi:hypothetical protein
MARSAQELFEEAMRLDPKERAALMRLLIDTLDVRGSDIDVAAVAHGRRRPGYWRSRLQGAL